jgi:isopenicillin-N epimerase
LNEISRRGLLTSAIGVGVASAWRADAASVAAPQPHSPPAELASNEEYWRSVAALYDVTDEVVHLEHGNWGVMSRPVLSAYERHHRAVNLRSSYYSRREYGGDYARIRRRVAAALGVDDREIVLTRGATEALQALIGGYNRLRDGDAVLYSDLDYDSAQHAMQWLRRRRGVSVIRIALPEPATYQSLIDAYSAALDTNPRIRLILLTHVTHRTGLVLPVKEIVALARSRGVDAIVDSAHAWGQIDFRLRDLGVDFAGLNMHKWIGAPLGVGVLYIRRDRIPDIDPFMLDEPPAQDDIDVRVHTGTANFAAFLAAADALDFHDSIGTRTKEARLRHLRDLWAERLRGRGPVQILTPEDPRLTCAITSFRLQGRGAVAENVALCNELLQRFGIFTVHRSGVASGACVRVTPAIFTPRQHIEKLALALESIARG